MSDLKEELNNAIREYKENYNNNALVNFINNNLSREKELLEVVPILMQNTNRANCRWLDNIKLCRTTGFIEKVVDNIEQFDFDQINFSDMIERLIRIVPSEKVLTDKFMLSLDKTNINEITYSKIYRKYNNLNGDKAYELFIKGFHIYNNEEIIKALTKRAIEYTRKDIIYENIDKIVKSYNDLFELNEITKDNKEINDIVRSSIESNEEEAVARLLATQIQDEYVTYKGKILKREGYSTLELKLEEQGLTDIIYMIIKEICENENVKMSDIYKIGEGATSSVLAIGSKVFKMGTERVTPKFNNNPYIIKPLLRRSFSIGNWDKLVFIEVCEKVDTKTEVTEEELYQLYKKVRTIGLIWTDVGTKNVGRLLGDNKIYWNKNLQPSDNALELDEYISGPELKKGELIILDGDFIFKGDAETWQPHTNLATTFEERYQSEKYMEDNLQRK